MAKGNWKPEVIKPKARCRLCRHVVNQADFVRLGGMYPAHRKCAQHHDRPYTEGTEIHLPQSQKED